MSQPTTLNKVLFQSRNHLYKCKRKYNEGVAVAEKGKGLLNVCTQDLSRGIFTYTLVTDGVTI